MPSTMGRPRDRSDCRQMAEALQVLPDAKPIAIGSRSRDKAEAFGREYDVPLRLERYEHLVACPEVDVAYIAMPYTSHAQDAALALRAGKPVLCEKPLTVNAREAESLVATALSECLFLMKAMWTRFVPAVAKLREWVGDGSIGEICYITTSIGRCKGYDPKHRLLGRRSSGEGKHP